MRLCPHCSGTGFKSDLWPFAACPPSLYPLSCQLFSYSIKIKEQKAPQNNSKKVNILIIPLDINT